uniref:Uncharacterized protein n=1 Tax=Sphingobacterium sp. (strain 21) TaxID=743722 RepID=F4C2E4_SPHS2
MSYTVRITVYPRVKRYLLMNFGPTLRISDKNTLSLLLRSLFQPFNKLDPSQVRPDIKKHSLGETYDIFLGNNGLSRYGGYMTGDNLKAFSEAVDLQIKEEMVRYVGHVHDSEPKVDYAIRDFLKWYGWTEEEFTFDNAKRWYYRERERQMKRVEEATRVKPQFVIPLNIEEEFKMPIANPIALRQLSFMFG